MHYILQVTGLMGSLNSPVSFGYYLQNFSYDTEGYMANAHEDVTFDYVFKIGETLDAGQWQVALTLYYQVGLLLYASTFFNETVTLIQPSAGSSWLLVLISLFATLCGAYYIIGKDALGQTASSNTRSEAAQAKARAEAAAAAQAAVDDDSWTAHLEYKSHDTKLNQDNKTHNRKPTKKASKNKRK